MKQIRKNIRKILSESIQTQNKRVHWSYSTKRGKLEGISQNEVIYAIGSEDFCESIKNEKIIPDSDSFSYVVHPSKTEPGKFILVESWQGFYD